MKPPRQTSSFLRRRFSEVGLQPASRHGQNFLIDLNLLELLLSSAELDRRDVVLEIGTGTGSLSARIAELAAWLVTVEIDEHLYQLASEELVDVPNVTMLHQDALHNKNRFRANVLEAVEAQLAVSPERRFKLVANLPYNIATPVVANLLMAPTTPTSLTVTIQKELADRMVAPPSTKDYSSLSVWVQSLCECRIVRLMPPTVFWPRPKVQSAIVHLEPRPEKRARIPHLSYFQQFVRMLFLHRRKFLRGVLCAGVKQLSKPQVDQLLADFGLKANARAEELTPDEILQLCEAVRAQVPSLSE